MAQLRKRHIVPKQQLQVAAITIDDPNSLIRRCIAVIRSLLNNKHVQFEKVVQREKILYLLKGGNGSKTIDAENSLEHWVIPILLSSDDKYWLGASLTFVSELAQYRLDGVSIRVFKGLTGDLNKTPLFRAEWDVNKTTRTDHAQPHWHVYNATATITAETAFEGDISGKAPEEFNQTTDKEEEEIWTSSNKFHFAMSSTWHIDSNHRIELSSEEYLLRWIDGSISYIQRQLAYISG